MTISLEVPLEGNWIGPGYRLQGGTTVFGPFTGATRWEFLISAAAGQAQTLYQEVSEGPITSVFATLLWMPFQPGNLVFEPIIGRPSGTEVVIQVRLRDTENNIDLDGPTQFFGRFWDPDGGLGFMLHHSLPLVGGDGFTAAERQQLAEVHRATSLTEYVESSLHLGLVGQGTIALLSSTRAVRWTVTTFPANVGVDPGEPNYYFNLGFITPFSASAWQKSSRVSFSPQLLVLPEICHQVAFDLAPGLVLELAELSAPLA